MKMVLFLLERQIRTPPSNSGPKCPEKHGLRPKSQELKSSPLHRLQGTCYWGYHPVLSQAHQQGNELEAEQPGLEPAL